eukprot:s110_g11.t1
MRPVAQYFESPLHTVFMISCIRGIGRYAHRLRRGYYLYRDRQYRAPEILLGSTSYTKGVDLWSVGCILGELLSGKPIFPGTSTMNQLDRIMEVTGRPNSEDVEAIRSPFAATMLESLPMSRPRPLSEMFPSASVEALDLLRLCLQFNPNKRVSAKEALRHPYVVQFHNPEDEFDCDRTIRIPIDDNTKLTVQDYRDRLYNEVLKKKKEQRRSHRRNLEMQQSQQQVVSQQTYQASAGQAVAPQHQPAAGHQVAASPQQQFQPAPAQHAAGVHRSSHSSGLRPAAAAPAPMVAGHQAAPCQHYSAPAAGDYQQYARTNITSGVRSPSIPSSVFFIGCASERLCQLKGSFAKAKR